MTAPSGAANATLAAAFKTALLNQGTLVFMIFVLLAIAWVACRELLLARARTRLTRRLAANRASRVPEPAARRVLRAGFGILWIFDGLLQAQPSMPGGLPSGVLAPAATGSPGWVIRTVEWGGAAWSAHPVDAAAGAVWIQLGIGVWLLSAASPRWSRAAGLMTLGWGLIIWIFGEAFGSLLAPGASWLMGAPGAALFYCAAGVLLALPLASWRDPRLGRFVLQAIGGLMLAFAVLQAWPGRGFWQGRLHGQPGPLAAAIGQMAATKQPATLHRLLGDASSLAASHGFGVNLATVITLAAIGGCLLSGRNALMRPAALAAIALCLADWVLVQDLGFLGGLGTDPNSMVPQALILAAGLLAMTTVPAAGTAADRAQAHSPPDAAPAGQAEAHPVTPPPVRARDLPGRAVRGVGVALGMASTSVVLTLWAGTMVLLGAVPMALATVQRNPAPVAVSGAQKPQLLTAALKADSHSCDDRTGAAGAGFARSSAASAQRVTSFAPAEVTMASPSSSSCWRLSRPCPCTTSSRSSGRPTVLASEQVSPELVMTRSAADIRSGIRSVNPNACTRG